MIVIGISGPSSSGKSTLARILRRIYDGSFILHQDDFYKAEEEIPITNGVRNWDCKEAVDFEEFISTLDYISHQDRLPPLLVSKEDANEVPDSGVSNEFIECLRKRVTIHNDGKRKVCIIDGFLLYHDPQIIPRLQLRILLRADYQTLKARRNARSGYVTLEGFWKDPPNYFEDIVWPEYLAHHSHLFQDKQQQQLADEYTDVIHLAKGWSMTELVSWAVEIIEKEAP